MYALSNNVVELIFGDLSKVSFVVFKQKTLKEFEELNRFLNGSMCSKKNFKNSHPEYYQKKDFIQNFSSYENDNGVSSKTPTVSILSHFDQIMCSRCLSWIAELVHYLKLGKALDNFMCGWVFSILAKIQKPLLSHTQSYISSILNYMLRTRDKILCYEDYKANNCLLLVIVFLFDMNFSKM